jgi:hypothetical protein
VYVIKWRKSFAISGGEAVLATEKSTGSIGIKLVITRKKEE